MSGYKNEEFLRSKYVDGGPWKRGEGQARQMPRLPSLKHTTVYDPDNDLIWEYETDWRSSSSDMRTFSPDVRMLTL